MSIEVTTGFIHPDTGDRVLVFNGKFLVRFEPKKLDVSDPWMVLISSDEQWKRWIAGECEDFVDYHPSHKEIEYGRQSLLKAYTQVVETLGILI